MALLSNTVSETLHQIAMAIGGLLLMWLGFNISDPLSGIAFVFIGLLFIGVAIFWRWG
ncbi:MAG: hypothetical protein QQN63_04120 [Nitrosopumilus sp.]